MPGPEFEAFIVAIKADENLQVQLESAEDAKSIVKLAKDAGFMIVEDEAVAFLSSYHEDEAAEAGISEEELQFVVAGGKGGRAFTAGFKLISKIWNNGGSDIADHIANRDTTDS